MNVRERVLEILDISMLKSLILESTGFLEADGFLKIVIEILHLVIKIMWLGFKN